MFKICLDDECHKIAECESCERNALIICFLINAVMFGLELYYGLIAHSASLLSDSAHNIGDALILGTSVLVIGSTLASKAKLALVKSIVMFGFGILTMFYVVSNISTGYVPDYAPITYVGIFVLIGNVASAILLLYYRHKDINLKSAYICCRNDAISSVGIIIAGLLIMLTKSNIPDIIIGGSIAILICYSAVGIFKESIQVISNDVFEDWK
jgi:cation diffusion facilitator family transporter